MTNKKTVDLDALERRVYETREDVSSEVPLLIDECRALRAENAERARQNEVWSLNCDSLRGDLDATRRECAEARARVAELERDLAQSRKCDAAGRLLVAGAIESELAVFAELTAARAVVEAARATPEWRTAKAEDVFAWLDFVRRGIDDYDAARGGER